MPRHLIVAAAALVFAVGCAPRTAGPQATTAYDFTVRSIEGKEIALAAYRGKVLLIVNTCSFCRLTPQYRGLQSLHTRYADRGLVVLGVPATTLFLQEPFGNRHIQRFCTQKYGVTFPMLAKTRVWWPWKHPLYRHLTSRRTNPEFGGGVTWNFNKFLVGRDGRVVARFGSRTPPMDGAVLEAVEKALAAKPG